MKPSFIGIGAQKCASSWLYHMLRSHPQMVVSDKKELNFFSYNFENGFRWYEEQFIARSGAKHYGEVSPSYFHEPGVVERVSAYSRAMLIIVSIRDPVERALSQHRHMVREGMVSPDDLSFETALASNPTYYEQGLYHSHLSRWARSFGRSQIHVVLMDDIREDSSKVVRSAYNFLGIDSESLPASLSEPRNQSYVIRRPGLHRVVQVTNEVMVGLGAGRLWKAVGDIGLRRVYRSVNRASSSSVIPEPMPETLIGLRERFRPDVERLEELLGRDLSMWRL